MLNKSQILQVLFMFCVFIPDFFWGLFCEAAALFDFYAYMDPKGPMVLWLLLLLMLLWWLLVLFVVPEDLNLHGIFLKTVPVWCLVTWFLFAGDEELYHRVPSNYVARTTARPEENPEVPFRIMAPSADPSWSCRNRYRTSIQIRRLIFMCAIFNLYMIDRFGLHTMHEIYVQYNTQYLSIKYIRNIKHEKYHEIR